MPGGNSKTPCWRKKKRDNLLFILTNYEPFHGAAGSLDSMNYLFADMHVGDLADQ